LIVDAASATTSATAAATSATSSASSATAAASSATAAASSATSATSSASTATTQASAASTSAAAAAASYDNFDDRWLGDKASDPSVDNDGNSLLDGAAYFNTTNNVLMVYDLGGTTWNRTTPTSADQTKINTVSGIASNVTTVAGISGNVTTVAGISSNVTTVAGISSDVTAVAADATDIGAVAAKATEIGRLGTADAVADMAILGTADVVTDMNVLATADVVTDMNTLGTADVVADMNVLGTADVVTDMNTLGTADVVADMNTLGTADIVADMNALAAKATEIGRLGTADAVADMAILGTADVVTDLNTLGTADIVTDMNTLGTAGNVTAMATCATNEASINRYSDEYTIAASAPGSPSEGDLWYDSTNNVLKYHNGSTFVTIASGIADVVSDGSPQLGGNLDLNGNIISGVPAYAVSVGNTANVNSSQGDNAITTFFYEITTCANAGDAVTLPTAAAGKVVVVANNGAEDADVFPASGDNVDAAGVNTAYSLESGTNVMFIAQDATDWDTISGGGGSGSITTNGLYEHAHTISANYVITTNNNALTAGPITIDTGVSVTVPTGSTWVIA
jgi:hypothetical protein